MIYIVEGIDRNGKTTLINKFINQQNFKKIWFGVPDKDPFEIYSEYFNSNFLGKYVNEKNLIFDRSFYSEVIYGNIFRNMNYKCLDKFIIFDQILKQHNAKIIFCETDFDTNWKLIQQENKKEILTKNMLKKLRNEANRIIFNFSTLPIIKYNFQTTDIKNLFNLN